MYRFNVSWEVEVFARSPEDAARCARMLQLAQEMPAPVFEVSLGNREPVVVDLGKIDKMQKN